MGNGGDKSRAAKSISSGALALAPEQDKAGEEEGQDSARDSPHHPAEAVAQVDCLRVGDEKNVVRQKGLIGEIEADGGRTGLRLVRRGELVIGFGELLHGLPQAIRDPPPIDDTSADGFVRPEAMPAGPRFGLLPASGKPSDFGRNLGSAIKESFHIFEKIALTQVGCIRSENDPLGTIVGFFGKVPIGRKKRG
jgi:hypothetical protein